MSVQTYFNLLPLDLQYKLLLDWFTSKGLANVSMYNALEKVSPFDRTVKLLLQDMWRRNISTIVMPHNLSAEVYNRAKLQGQYGIDLNATDAYNIQLYPLLKSQNDLNRALRFAVIGNHLLLVDDLINRGATDIDEALIKASSNGYLDIMEYLLELGATSINESFVEAVHMNKEDAMDLLISYGADDYNSALLKASSGKNVHLIRKLIDLGADNLNDALVEAAKEGRTAAIIELIENGANNFNGALLKAIGSKYNEEEIIKILINAGATNLNEALRIAVRYDRKEPIIKLLIEAGATNIQEVLDLAIENNYIETSELLQSYL